MKALALCLVLALSACDDLTGPSSEYSRLVPIYLIGPNDTLPGTATWLVMAVRAQPPETWRVWYREVERCHRLRGDFDAVRWYVVPLPWEGPPKVGTIAAQHGPDMIVLPATLLAHRWTIKHEITHDVLERNGRRAASVAHDTTYFTSRCLGA